MSDAYFEALEEYPEGGRYLASTSTGGPWDPRLQHGGPPTALLTRAAERAAATATSRADLTAVRVSVEFVGPVPVAELSVRASVVRAARSAVLVDVATASDGRECLRGRVWLVADRDTSAIAPARPPAQQEPTGFPSLGTHFPYADTIDWQTVSGSMRTPGPGVVWARPRLGLIAGEPLSGLQRVALVGDSASGVSAELDWDVWSFVNIDLDVHLSRPVDSDWILMDARTRLGGNGSALARSTISDLYGEVGCTAQTLVLARGHTEPVRALDDPVRDPEHDRMTTAPRERYGLELLAVLGVSLGLSGIYALLSLIRTEWTVRGGIGASTTTVISGSQTTYPWLDLLDDLADLLHGLAPPLLALVLLARSPAGRGFGVGFDLARIKLESLQGVGFLALIGIPGLALVYAAHLAGANASLQVVNFPDVWYRVPYLLASAFQNGLSEEIVVVAYMLTRLAQLGWSKERALLASALLRGSYHLYQGFGGFAGNFVMGLIFGWWFQRTRRVLPLVIAHSLLDAFSFIGYVYLSNRISWI